MQQIEQKTNAAVKRLVVQHTSSQGTHLFTVAVKHLPHRLMGQLYTSKRRRIRRDCTSHSGPDTREESLQATTRMDALDGAADRWPTLRTLQPGFDGVDGENGDPHGDTRSTTGDHDGRHAQRAGLSCRGVFGREFPLDNLVGCKVKGRTGPVTRECHGRATEHGANAALLVQLPYDVDAARVLWLLARCALLLALNLQEHLDTLERGGDDGLRDGAEESGGRDLSDAELVVLDFRQARHELFADIVAPERHGD